VQLLWSGCCCGFNCSRRFAARQKAVFPLPDDPQQLPVCAARTPSHKHVRQAAPAVCSSASCKLGRSCGLCQNRGVPLIAPAAQQLQDVGRCGVRALVSLKCRGQLPRRHVDVGAVVRVQERITKLRRQLGPQPVDVAALRCTKPNWWVRRRMQVSMCYRWLGFRTGGRCRKQHDLSKQR
jgi:hypothetical protein